ncbi:MAG: TIGR00159 family protein [Clostridiales bacterium]|nr:TIGR00159 family protein [Clostridiales bacterium]
MEFIAKVADFIWSNVSSMDLSDVLDIVIIAFVMYYIMTWVSRSGSARVIKGIIVVIIVLWAATLLEMKVVSFLLGKVVELGLLAIIVIFQPELRRIFEKVGSTNYITLFNRSGGSREMEKVISQTVQACHDMSRAKIGALIIFERNLRLDDAIRTGAILDAEVLAVLLRNIFYPKTPLHDGAVIIRRGRIYAAGCMLPLSTNPNLSKDLGMRHRAGIGASEVSDAVVVVVSEETGAISVAVGGMLKRHLAQETFERLLRNELLMGEEETKKKRLKEKAVAKVNNNDKKQG